jgi:hypothetical protein
VVIDAKQIAKEFLDQWEKAHSDGKPDYEGLPAKFARFANSVSGNEADAVAKELRDGRKARGWPDPKSDTLDPGIEGAILALWLSGLRNFRR